MTDLSNFTDAVGTATDQPHVVFAALEELTRQLIGVKLFTVMTADTRGRSAERVYSNMPDAYPVSGTKPYNETHWSEVTLKQKKTFVANSIEDIAKVFDDHLLIQSLGCESVINVPIVVAGEVIGTINCLDVAGHYTDERVEAAEALKLPGALAMLLHDRIKRT